MPTRAPASLITPLCLQCGLCCDGTLFRDVELQRQDRIKPLVAAGITLQSRSVSSRPKFPQPCAALGENLRCAVYSQRPCHCRTFECGTLLRVARAESDIPSALRTIRKAKRLQRRVVRLLRQLGDDDSDSPLKRRVERAMRSAASPPRHSAAPAHDRQTDHLRGDLSIAMHELNLVLAQHFYG